MADNPTEELKKRLVNELADAPQGTRDAEMPPSPNPFGGEVGPDPADDTLPVLDLSDSTGAGDSPETGEETDPGTAYAGGVNARNTDGSTRTKPQ
jgi:hypothetical protein